MILSLEEIRARLADRNLKAVASASGINYYTLYRLSNGYVERPTRTVMEAVSEYLTKDEKKKGGANA